MSVTAHNLGLRFKRYDIVHPSGPSFRAIRVTEKNKQNLFRYIESLSEGFEVPAQYDPTTNKLWIKQWRWHTLALGGRRRKKLDLLVREGDWIVQYHDATWERLSPDEFDRAVLSALKFRSFKFGGDKLRGVQVTLQNAQQVVNFVNAHGGRATVSARKIGDIRIYQRTRGKNWSKKDWRVATPGDYVIQHHNGEFFRVRKNDVGTIEFDN